MVRNAAALVTVSPLWTEQLGRRHSKPAYVVYNGYAEEDFPQSPITDDQGDVLRIRYTGSMYQGFRDPSALFAAIGLLDETLRERVIVEFFGDAGDEVLALAEQHGVRDRVAVRSAVAYRCALKLQMEADILLLLQARRGEPPRQNLRIFICASPDPVHRLRARHCGSAHQGAKGRAGFQHP